MYRQEEEEEEEQEEEQEDRATTHMRNVHAALARTRSVVVVECLRLVCSRMVTYGYVYTRT